MIPLTAQILDIIKKQGATGVLALWLAYTHFEVQDLKDRLYDCLNKVEYNPKQQTQNAPVKDSMILSSFEDKKKRK